VPVWVRVLAPRVSVTLIATATVWSPLQGSMVRPRPVPGNVLVWADSPPAGERYRTAPPFWSVTVQSSTTGAEPGRFVGMTLVVNDVGTPVPSDAHVVRTLAGSVGVVPGARSA
jgi:hypothetical protein